ncbi:helix-turn-helix domain-containing protein [Mucilaginibacter sp. 22184]|uniref:helix-turn-helix domain-containing protein n=1 Tax=Mucilaginibacter sp. 22184 TaxID=3453887 RepID=UPI003F85021D
MKNRVPYIINSITELHTLLGLPKPKHPLISIYRYEQITEKDNALLDYFCPQFYSIAIKRNFNGKIRYGHSHYDFSEGMMCFIGPGQLLAQTAGENTPEEGFCLMFHPDFLSGHPLGSKIKNYGFFSYELTEALHLSDDERIKIECIVAEIDTEYSARIDALSQDVMIAQIELLLHYSQRFYNRQFITRRTLNLGLLAKIDEELDIYLKNEAAQKGLPTVQLLADKLHVSANYLSDMLRTNTGFSTRQHIQNKLIEKSKTLLLTTNASVSEIAYQLGFEQPQSLSKLFRHVTGLTPTGFRTQLN